MAFIQQDTGRAKLWEMVHALTRKAHAHARQHEGHHQEAVETWLRDMDGSYRQNYRHAAEAAADPLTWRGLTEATFTSYVNRVLLNRVRKTELDPLVEYFEQKYWPLEHAWIKFRRKSPSNNEVFEHLMLGESRSALLNDTRALIDWAKEKIYNAYMLNKYTEAAEASNAIIWQLKHLIEASSDENKLILIPALLRISFYVGIINQNCGFGKIQNIIIDPMFRKNLTRYFQAKGRAAEIEIGRRGENLLRIAQLGNLEGLPPIYQSSSQGSIPPLYSAMGDMVTLLISQYNAQKSQGKLVEEIFEVLRDTELSSRWKHDITRPLREFPSGPIDKLMPAWFVDGGLFHPVYIHSIRRMFAHSGEEERTKCMSLSSLLRTMVESYHIAMFGGVDFESAILANIEEARLRMKLNGDLNDLLGSLPEFLARSEHHLTWSNAYVLCREYFESAGHQYHAGLAQKLALLAIECLDNKVKKEALERERQRIVQTQATSEHPNSELVHDLMRFVEEPPDFILDAEMKRIKARRQRSRPK